MAEYVMANKEKLNELIQCDGAFRREEIVNEIIAEAKELNETKEPAPKAVPAAEKKE